MKQCTERLYNGIIKENPTFVLMLGMCPTLAVTTSAMNGLGMGLSTMVVLALSNLLISALRKVIPDKVRIPAYIVIIATFVTLVELLLHAYIPSLHESLGIYISLIVVNCIILGRAESYASKNKILPSLFDGIGMGLGFTLALTLIGLVREFLGAGTMFGFSGSDIYGTPLPELLIGLVNKWLNPESTSEVVRMFNTLLTDEIESFGPMGIMVLAPGAFFILAILTAIQNVMKEKGKKAGKDVSKIQSGCSSDCMNCTDSGCAKRLVETDSKEEKTADSDIKEDSSEENRTEVLSETEESLEEEKEAEAKEKLKTEKETDLEAEENTSEEKDADAKAEENLEVEDADTDIERSLSEEKESEDVKEDNLPKEKEKKYKMTLLEATQEIDIVELEELLGEEEKEEGKADE